MREEKWLTEKKRDNRYIGRQGGIKELENERGGKGRQGGCQEILEEIEGRLRE